MSLHIIAHDFCELGSQDLANQVSMLCAWSKGRLLIRDIGTGETLPPEDGAGGFFLIEDMCSL